MIEYFEWPHCAKCGHGVEEVKTRQDMFTGDVIYTVRCHGETTSQRLTRLDLHDATLIQST